MTKTTQTFLCCPINLKPQNLSYLDSWLVVVVVFDRVFRSLLQYILPQLGLLQRGAPVTSAGDVLLPTALGLAYYNSSHMVNLQMRY